MHLTTTHKIDAGTTSVHTVTVFPSDCAEVVRKFMLALKAGDNIIEISHLPHTMVTESLRVAGIGQAMLSDVVCITPKSRATRLGHTGKSDELLKLEEEKSLLLGQKRVIDHQANILVHYAHSMTSENVSPDDMFTFLQNFNAMGEQSAQADVTFQRKLRELDSKIEKEINDPVAEHDNSHLRNIKVKLTINADEGHMAEISLTYLVKKASWTPAFDLRATTGTDGKPTTKLALHYRATVNQMTGEDWSDTVLNLSTASPSSFGIAIPNLHSMKVVHKNWSLFGPAAQVKTTQQNANNPFTTFTTNSNNNLPAPPTRTTGGLFGSTGTGTGLFGTQSSTTGTSLFGAQPAATTFGQAQQAPSTTGFGAFGQPASTTGGLFGAAPTGGGGNFGAPSTGGFGFGAASAPPAGSPQVSLFGQTAANPPQATPAVVAPPAAASSQPVEDFVHVAPTEDTADDVEPLPEMEIPSAVAKANSMAANFQVKGNVNIKSDGTTHKVAIAILHLEAKIQTVAVPRSIAGAYLHCTIHNSSKDTHLLAGNMGVYLDDGYISNTAVPHVAPTESFKCSLGRDNSVGVTFDQKSKYLYTPTHLFSENKDRVLYTVHITLKNKRENTIKGLIVRDIVPVSDGEPIKVVLKQPAGLAEAAEGKDVEVEEGTKVRWCEAKGDHGGMKEGQLQWTVDLKERESKTLVLEWEVIGPVGRQWQFEFHSPTKV